MAKITLGKYSYGAITTIGGDAGTINVGKYCSIAGDVKAFMAGDHNFKVLSQYPFGHPSLGFKTPIAPSIPTTQSFNAKHRFEINIGNDVWIGFGTILFRDTNVGHGCIIGAFSKITKDIPPYSVVVGNSRIVRRRYSDEDIEFLLKLSWWDLPESEVAEIVPILHNPDINLLKEWARRKGKI